MGGSQQDVKAHFAFGLGRQQYLKRRLRLFVVSCRNCRVEAQVLVVVAGQEHPHVPTPQVGKGIGGQTARHEALGMCAYALSRD